MPDSSLCMAICKKYCIPSDIVVRYVEEFAPFKVKLRDDSLTRGCECSRLATDNEARPISLASPTIVIRQLVGRRMNE